MWRALASGMKNRFHVVGPCLFLLGALAFIGCSEAADEVTNTVNCASVCNRYQECFDSDFDVEGCTDRCEDDADASENREERLESCDSCIDDKSCSEATFNCASQCAGIVP
jgi:hypothetical protein